MATLEPKVHAPVQARIAQFYRHHPDGSIRTFLTRCDGPEAVFEARVFRTAEDAAMGIYTSGWAREVEGSSASGQAGHFESCESAAVARALGHLGYTGGGWSEMLEAA